MAFSPYAAFLTAPDYWECLSDRGINGGLQHFAQEYAKIHSPPKFTDKDWLVESETNSSILDIFLTVTCAYF